MGVYIRNITKEQFIEDCNAMGVLVITEGITEIDLVRCGECKWWDYETSGCAEIHQLAPFREEDFCSYGERRADEGVFSRG